MGASIALLTAASILATGTAEAQTALPATAFMGVFRAVPDGVVLPGGLRNSGDLATLKGLPAPPPVDGEVAPDALKSCLPIGPFRMMARAGTKIELAPTRGQIVMLFEDTSHGYLRAIHLDRGHPDKLEPSWMGDSTGVLDAGGLTIDTVGFDDMTWLNDQGARHGPALHLVERVEPILDGRYLAYRVTATDPKALKAPFVYVRYYQKLDSEIAENNCQIED